VERLRPQFTPDEELQISNLSMEAAKGGQEEIDSITVSRFFYMTLGVMVLRDNPDSDEAIVVAKKLRHNVEFMEEIQRRAKVILQMEGKDFLGDFDKIAREIGLGSVYDPSSKAHEMYSKWNTCDCPQCRPK
jgi:hypothetical protein